MRIHSTTRRRLWPAAVVAAAACFFSIAAAANVDDPGQIAHEDVIGFDDTSFVTGGGTDAAVYSVAGENEAVPKTFFWTFNAPADVSYVYLVHGDSGTVAQGSPANKGPPPTTLTSSAASSASNNVVAGGSMSSKRQSSVSMRVDVNDTTGTIFIPDIRSIGSSSLAGYGVDLHFRVVWNNTGASYSRQFTVTDQPEDASTYAQLVEKFSSNTPYHDEQSPTSNSATQTAVSGTAASTSAGAVITNTASSPAGSTATPTISSNTKSGGGGLSTGAIAGIAVACGVIGLAAIGALIWFFCFRRRRGDGVSAAPYGSDRHHRTQELIAEKEANAGVNESSPISPYSDDGQRQQPIGMNGGMSMQQHLPADRDSAHFAGAAAPIMAPSPHPHSIDRSYTPYSDHRGSGIVGTPETQQSQPVHYDQSERGAPSPHPASQPAEAARSVSPPQQQQQQQQQQPIVGRYAHLVEEGMTEEEIRRLEDEERQLDAAIADREAGRGR